ncbi:MAG TPA: FAD binding domain-containing protein [Longimicrobiales bacterium]|nr:FAD binding domain-containing protein [Longimicrobiales bacterium]
MQLLRPRKLRDALRMLSEQECVPIAGCTDVFVELQFGLRQSQVYLDLSLLDELRGIRLRREILDIGAATTYADIERSRDVLQRLPILAAAAREIGGVQIQNRGTLGGNIGNGSPAGDTLPVLAVADAIVVLRSAKEERKIPFNEFYTGYRQSVRRPDELIVAVEIPPVEGRQWFRKVGTRAAQAISKIVAAGIRAEQSRFALGSVAPTVKRLPATEAALTSGGLEDAQQTLQTEIAPIDDIRSTASYRRKVAANLLAQFWHDTAGDGANPL